jgi:hypothetical protein
MKRTLSLILVVLAVLPLIGVFTLAAQGQAGDQQDCMVKVGKYRELNFWRQLKIGAAEYVNPGLFKTSALAYRYDVGKFQKQLDLSKLYADVGSGKIAFANGAGSDADFIVYEAGTPEWKKIFADFQAHATSQSAQWSPNYSIVTSMADLYGAHPSGQIVSWDATQPVTSSSIDACIGH